MKCYIQRLEILQQQQSIKYLLDTLYAGIFSFDYQKNLDYKIQIAKAVDDRHSGYEFIDEDEFPQ